MSKQQTLRLALAMRGGVSLAVWIGGAVAEIDLVRHACFEPSPPAGHPLPAEHPLAGQRLDHRERRREIYRLLLAYRNYQKVEVDILAGASAGGLNAVLYGFAQSVGSTVDWLDEVWRTTGGLWDLLRPTRPRGARLTDQLPGWVPSLLQGDEYFYVKVRETLIQHLPDQPSLASVPDHLTIDLSATLLDPDQLRPASSDSGRSAVHFHFEHRPAPPGSPFTDLPSVNLAAASAAAADLLDLQLARLALAGRSTSSFLLYLDPSPPSPKLPVHQDSRSAAEWAPTIVRSLLLKQRQETADQEIPQLRQHNERALAANSQRDTLADQIAADPAALIATIVEGYARHRASMDAARLAVLATRPTEALLRSAVPPSPHRALTEREALQISARITARYGSDPTLAEGLLVDAQAVLDVSTLLIAWIRALERQSATTDLGQIKQRLYRVLVLAQHVRDRADEAFLTELDGDVTNLELAVDTARERQDAWPAAPSEQPDDLAAVLTTGTASDAAFWSAAHDYFTHVTRTTARPGDGGLLTQLWEHLTTAREAITAVPPPEPSAASDWANSLFAQFYTAQLRELPLTQLHAVVASAGGVPGTASAIAFHDVNGDQPSPLMPYLDQVLDSARRTQLTRLLRTADAELAELTADAFPPAEGLLTAQTKLAGNTLANFGGFLSARWRSHDWTWGRMDAAAKLVDVILGAQPLATEPHPTAPDPTAAAGLAALWTNYVATPPPGFSDTQWAQLLGVPESRLPLPVPDPLTPQDDQRLRRASQAWLQCCVLADRQDEAPPQAAPVETLAAPLNRGKAGLSELPRSYLFGLASRVAQLTYRALWPRTLTGSTFTLGILMLLLRPLWVALPLLADPLRLAATAAVLTWLASLSWDGAHRTDLAGPGLATTATILLTIVAVVTVIRLRKADHRWRAVRTAVGKADPAWIAVVGESWARRRWWIRIGTTLAVLTVALAWLGWTSAVGRAGGTVAGYNLFGWWLPTTVLVAAVVTIFSIIVQRAQSAPASRVPAVRLRTRPWWMAAGLAVAIVVVTIPAWSAWAVDHAVQPDGPLTPTGHTIAAAVLLAVLLHQGWATRPGLIVAGMLIGASAWALAAWAAPWLPPLGAVLLAVGAGTAITSAFLQVKDSPVA